MLSGKNQPINLKRAYEILGVSDSASRISVKLAYRRLATCFVTVAWIAFLGTLFTLYWKRESSFRLNLALHWLLLAWLAWYAFPYLGELP
jgi:hypothetical protein